jgi:hypothetical protein
VPLSRAELVEVLVDPLERAFGLGRVVPEVLDDLLTGQHSLGDVVEHGCGDYNTG